jgi:hypothetical protein
MENTGAELRSNYMHTLPTEKLKDIENYAMYASSLK